MPTHGSPTAQAIAQALRQLTCVPWDQRERGRGSKEQGREVRSIDCPQLWKIRNEWRTDLELGQAD